MGYFDKIENVQEYMKMAEGFDGRELIEILKMHFNKDNSVLEIGIGPGKDLDILNESFKATGSDNSNVFLDLYREKNPDSDLILLDAITLKTKRKFDCLYSNKVLHHLTKEELQQSFQRQKNIISDGGILFHTFWYGDKEEEFNGLRFVYYNEDTIQRVIGNSFEIIEFARYTEMEKDDSFYIILKNKE